MFKKIIIYLFLFFCLSASYSQTDSLAQKKQSQDANSQTDSLTQKKKSPAANSQTDNFVQKKKLLEANNKRDQLNRRQDVWKIYNADGILISQIEYKNDKREGKCIIYYPVEGAKVKEEIEYFDGKKDGSYVKKYISGQTAIEGAYALGLRTGSWSFFYEDGQVRTEGNYEDGKRDGEWKSSNRKGELTRIRKCNNGKCKVKEAK